MTHSKQRRGSQDSRRKGSKTGLSLRSQVTRIASLSCSGPSRCGTPIRTTSRASAAALSTATSAAAAARASTSRTSGRLHGAFSTSADIADGQRFWLVATLLRNLHCRLAHVRGRDTAAGNVLELAIVGVQRFIVDGLAASLNLQATVCLRVSSSELRATGCFADANGCDNVDEVVGGKVVIVGLDRYAEGRLPVGGGTQFTGFRSVELR
jgi:hypothetical protein